MRTHPVKLERTRQSRRAEQRRSRRWIDGKISVVGSLDLRQRIELTDRSHVAAWQRPADPLGTNDQCTLDSSQITPEASAMITRPATTARTQESPSRRLSITARPNSMAMVSRTLSR
jgi:hypothetical protein